MENVDKRVNIKLISEWESASEDDGPGQKKDCARSLISKSSFHSVKKFSEHFYAFQMNQLSVYYNKPVYLGFSILEISKLKMYDFHYKYMKPKFNEKVQLNYMDTDSFIYSIKTEDFYNDIKNDIESYFDTSEFSNQIAQKYNFPQINKKKLGFFKDELNGKPMLEFVGLRSKMYSFKFADGDDNCAQKTVKKSKGVKRSAIDKIDFHDYKKCLLSEESVRGSMAMIRSSSHSLSTIRCNKIILSSKDDKRVIDSNKIDTMAYGHYKVEANQMLEKLNELEANIFVWNERIEEMEKCPNKSKAIEKKLNEFKMKRHQDEFDYEVESLKWDLYNIRRTDDLN